MEALVEALAALGRELHPLPHSRMAVEADGLASIRACHARLDLKAEVRASLLAKCGVESRGRRRMTAHKGTQFAAHLFAVVTFFENSLYQISLPTWAKITHFEESGRAKWMAALDRSLLVPLRLFRSTSGCSHSAPIPSLLAPTRPPTEEMPCDPVLAEVGRRRTPTAVAL